MTTFGPSPLAGLEISEVRLLAQTNGEFVRTDSNLTDSRGNQLSLDGRPRVTLEGTGIEVQGLGNGVGGALAEVRVPGQRASYIIEVSRTGGSVNPFNIGAIVQRVTEFFAINARGNVVVEDLPVPSQAEGSINFTRRESGVVINGDPGSILAERQSVNSVQSITVYTREYYDYSRAVDDYRSLGLPPSGGVPTPRDGYNDYSNLPAVPPLDDPRY